MQGWILSETKTGGFLSLAIDKFRILDKL